MPEHHLAVERAVNQLLTAGSSVRDTIPLILKAVGEQLGWDAGGISLVDPAGSGLRCEAVWRAAWIDAGGFAAIERQHTFAHGEGLAGETIPLAARLFAVVDIWDALRSDRPHHEGWPEAKVREHIRSLAGKHLDPRIVEVFLSAEW